MGTLPRELSNYQPVDDALNLLFERVRVKPEIESVEILRAYGRVLAQDVIAEVDLPPYDISQMDGFAVRAVHIARASGDMPASLRLRGKVKLGSVRRFSLGPREASRVPTGGMLPKHADTIVPLEMAYVRGRSVYIKTPIEHGSFVLRAGADIRKGDRVLMRGRPLRAQDIGLLAKLSIAKVVVFRKPRVAIISIGSELTNRLNRAKEGKVPESHSHIIARLVEGMQCIPVNLGVTPDSVEEIRGKIRQATSSCDVVLTIAGSSIGDTDLVEEAVRAGRDDGILVHGIKLDRGRVSGLGILGGKPLIILPGPIQGAVSAFIVLAYPLLRYLAGYPKDGNFVMPATLSDRWRARKKLATFRKVVYVKLERVGSGFKAKPIAGETEMISVLTKSDGFIIVPEQVETLNPGDQVDVHFFPGFSTANSYILG